MSLLFNVAGAMQISMHAPNSQPCADLPVLLSTRCCLLSPGFPRKNSRVFLHDSRLHRVDSPDVFPFRYEPVLILLLILSTSKVAVNLLIG